MKIAILSFYSGSVERGVENWVLELSARLVKKGHAVEVFYPPRGFYDASRIVNDLTLQRRFFVDYISRKIAQFSLKILPGLWLFKPDIVIPTNGGWQAAIIRFFAWVRGGKMVIVGHSGEGWDDVNNLWSYPDVFVALTKQAGKWARRVNPLVRVETIGDGVDLEKFSEDGDKARIRLKKPIVLAVGALEESKRLDLTIKAVAKLRGASLLILGNGSQKASLNRLGGELLGNRFQLSSVKHDEIASYYRACDVFTLPSWGGEAFGMVYLEAMAVGLSVVATDDEKRREIVGEAGILVDPVDIGAYAVAIDRALKRKWGDKPRKQAEKFAWEKIADKYEKLFVDLI